MRLGKYYRDIRRWRYIVSEKLSEELIEEQKEKMSPQKRYQEIKPKPSGRRRTFKELWDDERVWEKH